MPRLAWLAVGAAGAALVLPPLVPASGPATVGLVASAAGAGIAGLSRLVGSPVPARAGIGIAVGAVAIGWRLAIGGPAPPTAPLPEGSGPWLAEIEAIGAPRDGLQTATIRLLDVASEVRAAATLPRFPVVVPGARIRIDGATWREPPSDGYGDYLRRVGLRGTVRVRTLEVVAPAAGTTVDALRRLAGEALARSLPAPEAGLAAGILIGLRELVDRDLAAAFTTAGASHVVAISGWNIALVAGIVAALTRSAGRRPRAVLIAVAVVGYTVMAGASPSVVRAATMASVALLASETGRPGRAASALGGAVAVLLLADPGLVRDAGFQLSVVATAGLLAWGTPLTCALERAGHGRLPRWIIEGLGVSLAAQAATLPIVLGSFGRLSLVAPAVNLVVVPLVPLAMAAGVPALLGGLVVVAGGPAVVGTLLGLPAWLTYTAIVRLVTLGASVPGASLGLPGEAWVPAALVSLLAMTLGASQRVRARLREALGRRRRRPRAAVPRVTGARGAEARAGERVLRVTALAVAAPILLATLAIGTRLDRATRLTVLDVGQGDGILLETAGGGRVVIDGGPDPDRLLRLLDERVPPWDRRVDLVILTHPHEDHAAGLALVLDRYRVRAVAEPGMRGPGPGWAAWDERVRRYGIERRHLATGARLSLHEVRLAVLWPDPGAVPSEPGDTGREINDTSIVLLAEVGSRRLLLTGDIEDDVDPVLLGRGLPQVDLLKVAHHGSATATTDALLAATAPRIAVVSAGVDNPYGHPAPRTIRRLEATGARVLRTDRDGSVGIEIRDGRLAVRTTGGRAPRAAAAPAGPTPARLAGAGTTGFACAVPPTFVPAALGATPAEAVAATRGAVPVPHTTLRYDRHDDRSAAGGGRPPAVLPRPARMVPAALVRRRGHRGVAGGANRPARARRSARCRGSGTPPRCRQAAATQRCRPPPAPRPGLRGLARATRPRRAAGARRRPPGDPPGRSGVRAVARGGLARGAGRGVRGQARRPATRVDGRAVRLVGPPLPGFRARRMGCHDPRGDP